jgi:hypothetical protein
MQNRYTSLADQKKGTLLKLGAADIRVCFAIRTFVGRRFSPPAGVDRAADMAALQDQDCCDRARRVDVFDRLRTDRAGGRVGAAATAKNPLQIC